MTVQTEASPTSSSPFSSSSSIRLRRTSPSTGPWRSRRSNRARSIERDALDFALLQGFYAEHHRAENEHRADDHTTGRVISLGVPDECDTADGKGDSDEEHEDCFH